ncbi:DNA modification methylase [Oleidesulfovibrio alaskensis]|uniref:DNA modification methylase n=1 Tax=Oleidesulfovibrio alaskensis TaxID=58180 RepID=UPI001A61F383|nr:DNA modification methylase [Oleidesulfovibrio alaskensis]MBL3582607.1 DNA modification methylase [Oleidesulfovibrio alaskensis]
MENINVEYWQLDMLHSETRLKTIEKALPRMVEALSVFGFRIPVLACRNGEVIDGRLRLEAARQMQMESVPVIVADDLTPTQVRTFRLLVNRSATWAEWDEEALQQEFVTLRELGADLALTGFDDIEIDTFLQGNPLSAASDPDLLPEIPDVPVSSAGDLWLLGGHRLLCGDSTSNEDLKRLMAGERADMLWTDPPYNVDYTGKAGKIRNDKMSAAAFDSFLQKLFTAACGVLVDGGAAYVAHSEVGGGTAFRRAFVQAGFKLASCLIWKKHQMVLGRSDYHWQHEPILYGWKATGRHRWYGNRKHTTLLEHFSGAAVLPAGDGVWQVATGDAVLLIKGKDVVVEELPTSLLSAPKPVRSDLHPTMKPVALVERMVANSSPRGGLVFDPCAGSGTTLIACELLGRRCNTMEVDPRFTDVVVRRWQELTGKQAVLSGGTSFSQIAAEREVSYA